MTRESDAEPAFEARLQEVVSRALARLVEGWGPLAADLDSLTARIQALPGPQACLEFERLEERALFAGWWLAVLASAQGGAALGDRRVRRGLDGAEQLIRPAAAQRGPEPCEPEQLEAVAGPQARFALLGQPPPALEPQALEDGWRVPIAWLWFLDAAARGGSSVAEVERQSGGGCVLRAQRLVEPESLAAWVKRKVPGASVELAPGTKRSGSRLILRRSLVRWPEEPTLESS